MVICVWNLTNHYLESNPVSFQLEDCKCLIIPLLINQLLLALLLLPRYGIAYKKATMPFVGMKLGVVQFNLCCMSSLESSPCRCKSSSIMLINRWSCSFPSLYCSYRNRHLTHTLILSGRKNLSQPTAVLLCNTVISTASSMLCFSALCSSIFLPSGPARGSWLCNRLCVHFSKTARKQLCDAVEGEPNAQCFEFLTQREPESADGKVNNLTDALIQQ